MVAANIRDIERGENDRTLQDKTKAILESSIVKIMSLKFYNFIKPKK